MSFREVVMMRLYRQIRGKLLKPDLSVPNGLRLNITPYRGDCRKQFLKHFGYLTTGITEQADRILENKITVFQREVNFHEHIDWNTDFNTGRRWPYITSSKINIRDSSIGDPKDIWELNRQQFLPLLAKAFFMTNERKYADKAVSLMNSWIRQNHPCVGINWCSCIESALRLISWIWTLKFINIETLEQEISVRIYRSLYQQVKYIANNLSLYSSANNHLISELAALIIAGMHLRQYGWVKKSIKLLECQIENQILPDGVGAEQSPSYQANTIEYYILSALVLKENSIEISERILDRLARGAVFIQSVLDGQGYPPDIGDNDSGDVLRLSYDYSNYKSILNLTSYLTGNNNFLQDDVVEDEKSFWLLGPVEFLKLVDRCQENRISKRFDFKQGGYYILENVLNDKNVRLIFDCGPLGMKPMAGHGHADALSFILYINDTPVFIDPGTYTYYKSDFWRNYFRGTSAHNTIRIDGVDQSIFAGNFLASRHAGCECTAWVEGQTVSGRHSGYKYLKNAVMHCRTISFDIHRNLLFVIDDIETDGDHLIEQYFHLDSHCVLKGRGGSSFEINSSSGKITVCLDKQMDFTIFYGDDSLPSGWQSDSFDNKVKTFTMVGRTRINSSRKFTTEIQF